ncbi:type VI secretion protein, family [Tritonibacter multivorans]|uniref:Type VI secretion protein, family n=1 Tax=Tritonibacter multivorans TaxID=928856 RepID=A0A0N7LZM9_9RHOB|nr:type VI secretion system baseplate subunit TssG [Tritonibacter multivorans]MDA7422927.1 type VI secretion system baseplate subunit TssG [Tritonibacter multivorans]CUH78113.1 type VI secretion protein, family [Tritonibacter multivorans]SFD75325.1 type VI secretion system protein ImpH [Tritonibacter multivorans]
MSVSTDPKLEHRRGFGFLALMRWLERRAGSKPRVGQSRRVHDDIADVGQDPYLGFPDSDLSEVDLSATRPKVRPRFLGFFGPFGALPLAMTREAKRWHDNGQPGFTRFADIFSARFIQLFYRSWSDARPVTQFDHPSGGDFPDHLRALTGDAGPVHRGLGAVDDIVRLRYTGLQMGRVRSPVRLQQILRAHFHVDVEIEEFAASWLNFAPEDLSSLGFTGVRLGEDAKLGSSMATTEEKAVIHIRCPQLATYRAFLPGQARHRELTDLVMGYTGQFFAFEVRLWLPRSQLQNAQLGVSAEVGWMAVLPEASPPEPSGGWAQMCSYQIDFNDIHSAF